MSSDCLKNGSLWDVSSHSIASPDACIELRSMESTTAPLIRLSGTRDMSAVYAQTLAGLHKLACE